MPVRFQETPASAGEVPELEANKDGKDTNKKTGITGRLTATRLVTLVGTVLLSMVALAPICDAAMLLNSSTYVFFIGHWECFWIIWFCCAVVLFYIAVMLLISIFDREDKGVASGDQRYVLISTITLLGLGLLLFSTPMRLKTTSAYNELMSCNYNNRTEPVYFNLREHYNMLLNIRLKPGCVNKVSIEECTGYQQYKLSSGHLEMYNGFLKEMELSYECSGFCYSGDKALPATTPPPLEAVFVQQRNGERSNAVFAGDTVQDSAAFYQTHATVTRHVPPADKVRKGLAAALQHRSSKKHKAKQPQGMSLLAGDISYKLPPWVEIPEGLGDTANDMVATGWMSEYPPNLFTNANYKTTCDGAAARELRFSAIESAYLLYLEGSALLLIAVFAGFMKLCTMCSGRNSKSSKDQRL